MLHCPLFRDLRSTRVRNIEIGSEFLDSPRPSAALIDLLALCAKEPTQLQSLGSFVRLISFSFSHCSRTILKVREQWLKENVSCGLQLIQPAQVGLSAAQMYNATEAFTHGVAISIYRRHVASPFDIFFDFYLGAAFSPHPMRCVFAFAPFPSTFLFS